MADWKNILPQMVRHLINDISMPQEFNKDRIEEAVIVAGLIASQEFTFSKTYTFDLAGQTISPDPTNDNTAMALFSLKAACILESNRAQSKFNDGSVRVEEGDSLVDTRDQFRGFQDIINIGPCGSYRKLLRDRQIVNSMARGKAVMTPFTHGDINHRHFEHGSVSKFFDEVATSLHAHSHRHGFL